MQCKIGDHTLDYDIFNVEIPPLLCVMAGCGAVAVRVLDYSDSLNISERARWVACLLGRTRGHGRQDIIPSGRRTILSNRFDVSDGDVPAEGPLGRSGKNKGICSFFFFLALLAIFW